MLSVDLDESFSEEAAAAAALVEETLEKATIEKVDETSSEAAVPPAAVVEPASAVEPAAAEVESVVAAVAVDPVAAAEPVVAAVEPSVAAVVVREEKPELQALAPMSPDKIEMPDHGGSPTFAGSKWKVDTSYIDSRTIDPNRLAARRHSVGGAPGAGVVPATASIYALPAQKKYTLQELTAPPAERPADVDPAIKEQYLSPVEFQDVFGIGAESFLKFPKWKQQNLKKAKGLF